MEEHGEKQNEKRITDDAGKRTSTGNPSTAPPTATHRASTDYAKRTQETKVSQPFDDPERNVHKTLAKPPSFDTETEMSSTSDDGDEKIKKRRKIVPNDNEVVPKGNEVVPKDNEVVPKHSENTMKRKKKPVKGVRITASADISEDRSPSKEEVAKQLRRRDTPVIPHGSTLISAEVLERVKSTSDTVESMETDTGEENSPEKDKTPPEASQKTGKSQPSPQVKNTKSPPRNQEPQKPSSRPSSAKSTSSKRSPTLGYKSNTSKVVQDKPGGAPRAQFQKRTSWSSEVTSKTEIMPGNSKKTPSRESFGKRSLTKHVNPGEGKKLSLQNTSIKDTQQRGSTQTARANSTKSSSEVKSPGSQTTSERGSIK